MKILLTGSNGQLGKELQQQLYFGKNEIGKISTPLVNADIIATDFNELDITKEENVRTYFRKTMPDLVLNCAAFTNVDECEKKPELAFQVNAIGPKNLAIACAETQTVLVHISTDYVFSGRDNHGLPQDEDTLPNPISVYGKTKLLGELNIEQNCNRYFILRTAWLYGYYGKNFVKTIVAAGKKYGHVDVVNDQYGNPTNAVDLANEILQICVTDQYGLYHCTGNGICSWYEFAKEIIDLAKVQASVTPCTSKQYQTIHPDSATRPAWSALDHKRLRDTIGDSMRPWKTALQEYFKQWDGKDGIK